MNTLYITHKLKRFFVFLRVLKASGSNGSKNKEYLVVFDNASPLTITDLFPKVPDRKSIWPSFKLNHRFFKVGLKFSVVS